VFDPTVMRSGTTADRKTSRASTAISTPSCAAAAPRRRHAGAVARPGEADQHDLVCHLIAVSMDHSGWPSGLFTTNRWVTGETWYATHGVAAMLDGFDLKWADRLVGEPLADRPGAPVPPTHRGAAQQRDMPSASGRRRIEINAYEIAVPSHLAAAHRHRGAGASVNSSCGPERD
jgi:hypothetical protein